MTPQEPQEMFEHFRLEVDPGQAPLRIDKYMSTHLEDTSRNRIQQAFKEGYVRVGETPVKANYIVRPGDVIRFVMPYRRRGLEIIPQDIPLNIVFEDDDVLVVNKPAGMVVHPGHGHYEGTPTWASARTPRRSTSAWASWCTASTRTPAACWPWPRTMSRS